MSPVIYFSATCYLLLLQCTSSAHTSPLLSLLCFLCKGISDSAAMRESKKKREKSLHLRMRVGKTRYSAINGAVSADGESKRSSGVDDLARNEPPSQVLALTSRCHM